MCTVLLPPGGYPIAINKYIISYHIISYHIIAYHIKLVLLFLLALLLTAVGPLCIVLFIILCLSLLPYVYCFTVCIAALHTLVAGLLARSQYPEGTATGHLDTGFSRFRCVYKLMLRWFPRLQVATACFLCSPPDLNFLDTYFIFMV
jgi:hypothetical protein